MLSPESSWSVPPVFPQFGEDETVAVDLETYDPYAPKKQRQEEANEAIWAGDARR